MNIKYLIELFLLGALWGASFIFLRISTPEFGPVPLITLRTSVAALCLLPFLYTTKRFSQLLENWKSIFILGLISTVIPYTLFSYTTLYASAGYTSILNATTPMFSTVVAYFWIKERVSMLGLVGILIGFLGVFILVFDTESIDVGAGSLPVIAALFAAFFYGVTGSYSRSRFKKVSPLVSAIGSQIAAAIILLPFSIYFWPAKVPASEAWISAIILGVACTGVALVLYYRLINSVGVAKTVIVTYLIPVFGILWGNIYLEESITVKMFLGGILILTGVGLTTGLFKYHKKIHLRSDKNK